VTSAGIAEHLGGGNVYRPQEDSRVLIETALRHHDPRGQRVADLCAGSGVVGIAAAEAGAHSVRAFEICPSAVQAAKANAAVSGVELHVHHGPWTRAAEFGPYDLVLSNPPYVPVLDGAEETIPAWAGPALAYNGGVDGREVLDPLCGSVVEFLAPRGEFFLVQSEFSGVDRSVDLLTETGLCAKVVSTRRIPFGPVLSARAEKLERAGLLEPGRRVEELVVIRAARP